MCDGIPVFTIFDAIYQRNIGCMKLFCYFLYDELIGMVPPPSDIFLLFPVTFGFIIDIEETKPRGTA